MYLPPNFRSANVVIRPPVRSYEIPLGVPAGVPPSHVIPLDELVAGVENGRFYLRWPAAGKRVIVSSGHMLNLHTAPPVGRFLVDVSNDARPVFSTFDWGPAESFPFLPRVQVGRVVLAQLSGGCIKTISRRRPVSFGPISHIGVKNGACLRMRLSERRRQPARARSRPGLRRLKSCDPSCKAFRRGGRSSFRRSSRRSTRRGCQGRRGTITASSSFPSF